MTEKSAAGSGTMSDKSAAVAKPKATGDAGKDARAKDSPAASAVKSETSGTGIHSSPKKRRKVNHGKVPFARYATGIYGRKPLEPGSHGD
jgi:hypothetical protein